MKTCPYCKQRLPAPIRFFKTLTGTVIHKVREQDAESVVAQCGLRMRRRYVQSSTSGTLCKICEQR